MLGHAPAAARRIPDGAVAAARCCDRRCLREQRLHRRNQPAAAKILTIRRSRAASGERRLRSMQDLPDEMRRCKSVQACIELALTDAYGEDEQAVAWLTCIEALFGRFKRVKLLDEEVALVGFDLNHHVVIAVCRKNKQK